MCGAFVICRVVWLVFYCACLGVVYSHVCIMSVA